MKNEKLCVVIVDDTPENLDVLNHILTKNGYDVRLFPDPNMALDSVRHHPPHLFLIDIIMPVINGFQLASRLKKNPITAAIPIIFISALFDIEDKIKAFDCGGADYIVKPFHETEVLARAYYHINTYLQQTGTKKDLETTNKQYKTVFNMIIHPVLLTVKENSKIIDANPAAVKFYGRSLEELKSLTLDQLRSLQTDEECSEFKNLECHICAGEEKRYVEIISDELIQENRILEYFLIHDQTEMVNLNKTLLQAKQDAEKASRLKSIFLANINHELRTPITGAMGMLSLLKDTELSQHQMQILFNADDAMNKMHRIINDLLDFSDISSGRINPVYRLFNIHKTAVKSISRYQTGADKKNIRIDLQCEPDLEFAGDEIQINMIIGNLISNAVKFSEKGTITVKISKQEKLLIEVQDQGVGIEEENFNEIFNSFHQIENPYTKKHEGIGIGLSIVYNLVILMKGTITVESRLNEGSLFRIILPEAAVDTAKKPKKQQPEPRTMKQNLQILIAEDDSLNRLYLKLILERQKYKVIEAINGIETVEKTLKHKPDLILMDIGMPKKNGMEAMIEIHEQNGFQSLPVIVLTAHTHITDISRFKQAGALDVIEKPYTEKTLFDTINRYFS